MTEQDSAAAFDVGACLARQAGLCLSAKDTQKLAAIYPKVRRLVEHLRHPEFGGAEPATVYRARARAGDQES